MFKIEIFLINLKVWLIWMIINHSTLDYHVTILTRPLNGSDGQIKTLYRPNPEETFDLLPYTGVGHVT